MIVRQSNLMTIPREEDCHRSRLHDRWCQRLEARRESTCNSQQDYYPDYHCYQEPMVHKLPEHRYRLLYR